MHKQKMGFFCVLFMAATVFASDYFPANVGNAWEFDYESYSGHSRGGTTDSGIVTWTVIKIEPQGSGKKITIRQKRTLRREIFFMVAYDKNYDSVFNPPREVSSGDITFIDSDNKATGTISLCNEQKTAVLIHDINGKIPSGIAVQKTTSTILGSQRSVIALKNGFNYKQCENIGPVEFSDSVQIGMNGTAWENWKLRSLPLGIQRDQITRDKSTSGNRMQTMLLVNESQRPNFTAGPIYDLYGRILRCETIQGKSIRADGVYIRFPENRRNLKQH